MVSGSVRVALGMVHNMAIKGFMQRLENGWNQRRDCYNDRHKLRPEKFWTTENYMFFQTKCKRCGVRKVTRKPLVD